jgi:hypothetical protein
MVTIRKVIVKIPKQSKVGKKKYRILHDQEINPPCEDTQILAALKQQYDVLSYIIEDGVATALVGKKKVTDEAE